ncbi:YueI family protein [Streptococcus caballi]|uniref:YueI family protein n=1 Tax=Streptococcus caballi TaxID=439220 RepID=UPI0003694555|nr:YueI family protein [Streptococcus caballi]
MEKIIDKKVMQATSGEKRFNPDEQRKYFGTFAERVVLSILFEDAQQANLIKNFESILAEQKDKYDTVILKISSKLSLTAQMSYMKVAQKLDITATIIDESKADSPFGIIVHTDLAENLEETNVKQLYPQYFEGKLLQTSTEKKSFWKKLFH